MVGCIYLLHNYDSSILMPTTKDLVVGFHTAEFHPKRKKLKYYQKKKRK